MANKKKIITVIQLENGEETQTCFTGEDIQMANMDMRRCSMSLANKQMQIEATMRCQCICNRMVKINNRAKYG